MEELLREYIRKNFYRKQRCLAESAKISQACISRFMTGGGLSVYNFERLCKALDITWQPLGTPINGAQEFMNDDSGRLPTSQESQSTPAHQCSGALPPDAAQS